MEFTFQKSTILEIDLLENELVTVLTKHDEGGNEGEIIFGLFYPRKQSNDNILFCPETQNGGW